MKQRPTKLSNQLRKKLEAYALAASAAGTGLLLAPSSEAEIVYTPANVNIAANSSYGIDLNGDGIIDFTITEKQCYCWYGSVSNRLWVQPALGNFVLQDALTGGDAAVLQPGSRIPNNRNRLLGQTALMYGEVGKNPLTSGYWYGYWSHYNDTTHKYLGLAFRINGELHYGWARMTVRYNFGTFLINSRVEGFAYETDPGKPIIAGDMGLKADAAPEKPTLGALAAGAPGLAVWRKQ